MLLALSALFLESYIFRLGKIILVYYQYSLFLRDIMQPITDYLGEKCYFLFCMTDPDFNVILVLCSRILNKFSILL